MQVLEKEEIRMKPQIIIVCGYVYCLDSNHLLSSGCTRFLLKVIEYCFWNSSVRWIVVSGGFSRKKTLPQWSEALVMKEFLNGKIPQPISITEENESLTTLENLKNTREMVRSWEVSTGEKPLIIIFCDAVVALRVKLLAKRVFKDYEVHIETHDLSPLKDAEKQFLACAVDLAAYYFPPLASLRRKVKEWQAKRA